MNRAAFAWLPERAPRVPLLVSVPHCGTEIPKDLAAKFCGDIRVCPEDTDWHVQRLYDFVRDLGVPVLCARYSRYVIDLNRDPEDRALYEDGRRETTLCPTFTFSGKPLYRDPAHVVDEVERTRRRTLYFDPYHKAIQEDLALQVRRWGVANILDAHSILRRVESISKAPFADMILGDNSGRAATQQVTQRVLEALRGQPEGYDVSYNHPFRGGYITRSYGREGGQVQALQIEMSQDVYLRISRDQMTWESEPSWDVLFAAKVQGVLRRAITAILPSPNIP